MAKETYFYGKTDLFLWQKRPTSKRALLPFVPVVLEDVCDSFGEVYLGKRDLLMRAKALVLVSKRDLLMSKRDLLPVACGS
jgi:hypothetical protein